MRQVVPFKKDIIFKTNISELTSISLEHGLQLKDNNLISGEFIISGDYKIADNSYNNETFNFNIPFDINMDERFDLSDIVIDIDDFYYEIVNNNVLRVSIDVSIDHVKEKPLINKEEFVDELISDDRTQIEEEPVFREEESHNISMIEEEIKVTEEKEREVLEPTEKIESLFDSFDDSNETYTTYKIYIVREEDTLESITTKYNISTENLSLYNDITELKSGDKIIIPKLRNEQN